MMADRVGQQLGSYRLTRLLGRGGFADVYLGEHIYLRTLAAVKVLQTRLSNEQDLESFLNEARTIAHLSHPNIVRVLDFGVDGEIPFLVMDYAPNGTLRQRHPRGSQLPTTTIIPYIKHIADALQYAHDEKLIHRDIKPENLLLGRRNEVLLSDFGIALIAQSSRYQNTQDVVGTVAYMSPEQIQGKPRPASDQYSLGIVVYEWLCGDRPFHGSFTELCTQHMFAQLPPLKEKVPTIEPAVEQVVSIALAKDPKQRFSSISAFANALEQAASAQATHMPDHLSATPIPPPPPSIQSIPQTQIATPNPVHLAQNQQISGSNPYIHTPPSQDNRPAPLPYAIPYQQPVPASEKAWSAWKIGKREIGGMLISLIIAVVFAALSVQIFPLTDESIPLRIVWLAFVEALPLFFAAAFGPWVGLFIIIDFFIGDYIYLSINFSRFSSFHSFTFNEYLQGIGSVWFIFLIIAVIEFSVGLSVLKTRGRYNRFSSFALVEFISVITITVITIIVLSFVPHDYTFNFTDILLQVLLYSLPGLILLPIFLMLYDKVAYRQKRTA